MIPFHSFLAAALLACACAAQAADVRKCVDARGKVTYVDGPCPRATQPERLRSPSPAPPAVAKLGAGVRFYEVEGIEHQALLASLNERGPNGFHAHTQWRVLYAYKTALRGGRCAVTLVETQVKSDILMPRWAKRHGASADLVARWQVYEAKLLEHEEGHVRHGRELAAALEAELPKLPPAPDCRALDASVRVRFEELQKVFSDKDKAYDERTQHGRMQGAVFQ